jgi:hypothetical protein
LEVPGILFLGFGLPLLFVGLALRLAFPAPRWRTGVQLFSVVLVPLVLLSTYLVIQYRTWRWAVFPYGSLAPDTIAAVIFLAGLGTILYRSSVPASAKAIVGLTALVCWVALWFFSALVTSCAMGDCL